MGPEFARAAARVAEGKRALAAAYQELAGLADREDDPVLRGNINALLWECAAGQPTRDRYFSQFGQDAYLDSHVFGGRRDGVQTTLEKARANAVALDWSGYVPPKPRA